MHNGEYICKGKIRYSKHEAKQKRIINLQYRNPNLFIYQCPHCFDYHLTSTKQFDYKINKQKQPTIQMRKKRFRFIPSMHLDNE